MSALPGLLLPWLRQFWSCGAIGVLGLLAWHFDARAVANADAVRTQAAQFKQAQADATRIAQQALEHEDLVYRQKAQEADSAYQAQLADARAAADRYIAAHRVQPPAAQGRAGGTAAATHSNGTPVPPGLPADAVVVSGADVQACTDAVTYAVKAHDWAGTIDP